MPDYDLNLAVKFAHVEIKHEPVVAPAKQSGLQRFSAALSSAAAYISQKIGLFDAPAFIARINTRASPSNAPQEEIGYRDISAKVLADKNGVGVLRSDCARARKIASDCLNSMELQKNPSKIDVFRSMNERAVKVQEQLERIENVNKLKKQDPELASILDDLYKAGKYELGDQLFKDAKSISKDPNIRALLKNPRSNADPKFFALFCRIASQPKNQSTAEKMAKFLNKPEVQRDEDFFANFCIIASDPNHLNTALEMASRGPGAFNQSKAEAEFHPQVIAHKQNKVIADWEKMLTPQPGQVKALKVKEILIGEDRLQIEADQYNSRLAQAQIQVGDNLLWANKLHVWNPTDPSNKEADKQKAIGQFRDDLAVEFNKHTDPPLTRAQSNVIAEQIINLGSVNALGVAASDHKKSFLEKHFGAMGEAQASSLNDLEATPARVLLVKVEEDGTVMVKGPLVREFLMTDPRHYYGVQAEARIKLSDLVNSSHENPPQWQITTQATPLFSTPEESVDYAMRQRSQ